MELMVKRLASGPDATIGGLYLVHMDSGWQELLCFTLEDEYRTQKVMGETRIPGGRYQLKLRKAGGHHKRYKEKFAAIHKGMIWVRAKDGKGEVPGIKWILWHIGNTDDDTAGCLLLGDSPSIRSWAISRSTDMYKRVYPVVADAIASGEKVFVTYHDADNSRPVDECE